MPDRNAAGDRQLKFIGGRILGADELNRLQQFQRSGDSRQLGAIFRNGATANVKVTINAPSVTLEAADPSLPMLVFLNGYWEPFQPVTISFEPGKTSGQDFIFLNYVVWRVTFNTAGTITDASLVDAQTQEQIGEVGQLELSVEKTDKSTVTTGVDIDPSKQFEKNATPIKMVTLQRGPGGSISLVINPRAMPGFLGSKDDAGLVRLSYGSSGIAMSADDPALSGIGDPKLRSIASKNVIPLTGRVPPSASSYGWSQYNVNDNEGIKASYVLHESTGGQLETIISTILGLINALSGRITVLEASSGSGSGGGSGGSGGSSGGGSLPSGHIGAALGRSDTHPASVASDSEGFSVARPSAGAGSATNYAFKLADKDGVVLAGITQDGDFLSAKAGQFQRDSTPLNRLSVIAQKLAGITGSGGGGGVSQSYVDALVATTLAAAKAYTDAKPAGSSTSVHTPAATNINWHLFRFGSIEIALGYGALQNDAVITLPTGFSPDTCLATCGAGRIFADFAEIEEVHCYIENNRTVKAFTKYKSGVIDGFWANVSAIVWRAV